MSADIRMLVEIQTAEPTNEFFHVIGRPVKMEWSDTDRQLMPFGSWWIHERSLWLERLQVRCQGNRNEPLGPDNPYTFSVGYEEPHRVGLHECEAMIVVLRRIERRMERMHKELGPTTSFAGYLARVAKALNIKSFGWRPEGGEPEFRNGYKYQWGDASMMSYVINSRMRPLVPEQAS